MFNHAEFKRAHHQVPFWALQLSKVFQVICLGRYSWLPIAFVQTRLLTHPQAKHVHSLWQSLQDQQNPAWTYEETRTSSCRWVCAMFVQVHDVRRVPVSCQPGAFWQVEVQVWSLFGNVWCGEGRQTTLQVQHPKHSGQNAHFLTHNQKRAKAIEGF